MRISMPVERRNGNQFLCPECNSNLVYRTGGAGWIYRLFTAITVPIAFLLYRYGDIPWVHYALMFIVLPVSILAAVYYHRSEYIEEVEV